MSIGKMAGIGVAVVLVVAGALVAGSLQDPIVLITETGYEPAVLEVVVGHSVRFENTTRRPQTVTSRLPVEDPKQEGDLDKGGFDSGPIRPGATWTYKFAKEGTFEFFNRMDRSMTGTIVVKPAK